MLTNPQVLAFADGIAKAISDYNANYVLGTASASVTINAGVGGVTPGSNAFLARNMALASVPDLSDLLGLVSLANEVAVNVAAYQSGIQSLTGFYAQFYGYMNKLDLQLGGLNAFLIANNIQVNAFFAAAFNAYVQLSVSLGLRNYSTLPALLSPATYFPYQAVDNLWNFTASGATTFSANAVGANASTSLFGGGVGQLVIYKNNGGNAAAGATFTITYINAAGNAVQATYTTAGGAPNGSGNLGTGAPIIGAIGSAVTAISGSSMTSGEQYTIGVPLVRAVSY